MTVDSAKQLHYLKQTISDHPEAYAVYNDAKANLPSDVLNKVNMQNDLDCLIDPHDMEWFKLIAGESIMAHDR